MTGQDHPEMINCHFRTNLDNENLPMEYNLQIDINLYMDQNSACLLGLTNVKQAQGVQTGTWNSITRVNLYYTVYIVLLFPCGFFLLQIFNEQN